MLGLVLFGVAVAVCVIGWPMIISWLIEPLTKRPGEMLEDLFDAMFG